MLRRLSHSQYSFNFYFLQSLILRSCCRIYYCLVSNKRKFVMLCFVSALRPTTSMPRHGRSTAARWRHQAPGEITALVFCYPTMKIRSVLVVRRSMTSSMSNDACCHGCVLSASAWLHLTRLFMFFFVHSERLLRLSLKSAVEVIIINDFCVSIPRVIVMVFVDLRM